MHIDAFLAQIKEELDQFEVYMKSKYPDICEGKDMNSEEWFEQFVCYFSE